MLGGRHFQLSSQGGFRTYFLLEAERRECRGGRPRGLFQSRHLRDRHVTMLLNIQRKGVGGWGGGRGNGGGGRGGGLVRMGRLAVEMGVGSCAGPPSCVEVGMRWGGGGGGGGEALFREECFCSWMATANRRVCVVFFVCVCVCVRACVRACMCVCGSIVCIFILSPAFGLHCSS